MGLPPGWHKDAVSTAMRCAGNSAPGPDGIPYVAYKASGIAADILEEAAIELFLKGDEA